MSLLTPRQSPLEDNGAQYYGYGYDGSNCYEEHTCGWWWSPTGSAVRYTIVSILFFLLFAYFVGGYWHARRRLRKNLPPLAYHRWMVRTSSPRYHYNNAAYNHNYPHGAPMYHQNPYYGQQQHPDSYGMQNSSFAPPPPAYQAGDAPPPVYQPPQGSSKVAADQNYQQGARDGGGESSSEVQAPNAAVRST